MLIEFAGLPGTGKSTLADMLRADLVDRGHSAWSVNDSLASLQSGRRRMIVRLNLAGRFSVRHPVASARVACLLANARQRRISELRTVTLNLLSKCELVRRVSKGPGSIGISDEGVFHALWSGLYGVTSRPASRAFTRIAQHLLELVPVPDIVVIVDAPDPIVVDRLVRNPSRNRLGQDVVRHGEHALSAARSGMSIVEQIIGAFERTGEILIVRVTNDSEAFLPACVRQISSEVERWQSRNA